MVALPQTELAVWTQYAQWISVQGRGSSTPDVTDSQHQSLTDLQFHRLCTLEWLPAVSTLLQSCLQDQLRQVHMSEFLTAMSAFNTESNPREMQNVLLSALSNLSSQVTAHLAIINQVVAAAKQLTAKDTSVAALERIHSVKSAYLTTVREILQSSGDFNLQQVLVAYFAVKLDELKVIAAIDIETLLEAAVPETPGAMEDTQATVPPEQDLPDEWRKPLLAITDSVASLQHQDTGLEAASAVVRRDVHRAVSALQQSWLGTRILGSAEQYMHAVPLRLLRLMLPSLIAGDSRAQAETLEQARLRLQFFVYDTIGHMYISCMFEIMMAFPETAPAVQDCADCLKRTNLHQELVDSLLQAVSNRLLHPGVATENILDGYINAIKVLQCIDKNGILMAAVTPPVKSYLRSRPDTIRCVVKMLTQEDSDTPGDSLLSDMRAAADGEVPGDDFEDLEGTAAVLEEAATWAPTSVELDNVKLSSAASFDIISTLVDIYGDALFVTEYKRMLGSKLMKKADFDTDFETRTLELLKLRFVESELHHCDVMLKDMQHSRRHLQNLVSNDKTTQAELAKLQPHLEKVSVLICSHLFWPKLPNCDFCLTLPAWLEESTSAHSAAFHLAKMPRKLTFASTLGVVELDLQLGDSVLQFAVSPILATILLQFQEQSTISADDLSAATNIPMDLLLRKALFWVQHGVLTETRLPGGGLQYRRCETSPENCSEDVVCEDAEEEDLAPPRRQQADADSSLKQFLPVINNMLQSSKQCTLERLHKLLNLFGAHLNPKFDKTEDELLEYLNILVERGHLKCEGSQYRLEGSKRT